MGLKQRKFKRNQETNAVSTRESGHLFHTFHKKRESVDRIINYCDVIIIKADGEKQGLFDITIT